MSVELIFYAFAVGALVGVLQRVVAAAIPRKEVN